MLFASFSTNCFSHFSTGIWEHRKYGSRDQHPSLVSLLFLRMTSGLSRSHVVIGLHPSLSPVVMTSFKE